MKRIESVICAMENCSPEALHCKVRGELAELRQIVMYFTKVYIPDKTWESIGAYYGQSHSNAMHAYRIINDRIETNKGFRERIKKHDRYFKVLKYEKKLSEAETILRNLEYEALKLENKITELKDTLKVIHNEIIVNEN